MRESLDRKIKALKDKHAQEVTQLEDELAELARKNEEQRVRSQSSSNEVVEKKVASTIESYTDKMKRAVSATENLWKAKLKAAQDDQVRRCTTAPNRALRPVQKTRTTNPYCSTCKLN
jgi:hypothetical protein